MLVLDEHNIEYELLYRMYQTERSAIRRFYNWLEFTKFKREELSSWRRVSGCVMTSAREQQIVQVTGADHADDRGGERRRCRLLPPVR